MPPARPRALATPAPCKPSPSLLNLAVTDLIRSGLFSFASTTFILSLVNVTTRGVHTPNIVVGMAIFCGGLVQLLAGMWEFPRGNVFGATGEPPFLLHSVCLGSTLSRVLFGSVSFCLGNAHKHACAVLIHETHPTIRISPGYHSWAQCALPHQNAR